MLAATRVLGQIASKGNTTTQFEADFEDVIYAPSELGRGIQVRHYKPRWTKRIVEIWKFGSINREQIQAVDQEIADNKSFVVRGDAQKGVVVDPPDEWPTLEVKFDTALFANTHLVVAANGSFLRHRFSPKPTSVATPNSLPKRNHVAKEAVVRGVANRNMPPKRPKAG